ncbi:hypothetical protein AVEN_84563-1 [Araneus ventricosus]|uniref:Uncharacterized protein n=1 Tax=Araneus ventricosus TaxID=182803 RepID=A0A4Y2C401_ARAVE|nr:hypothetical protein AVEN_84563-1 [Araneus ventricosus]
MFIVSDLGIPNIVNNAFKRNGDMTIARCVAGMESPHLKRFQTIDWPLKLLSTNLRDKLSAILEFALNVRCMPIPCYMKHFRKSARKKIYKTKYTLISL